MSESQLANGYKEWKMNYKRFFEEVTEYREMPELQDKSYNQLQNKVWHDATSGLDLVRFYQRVYPRDRLTSKANIFYQVAFKNIFQDENEKNKIKITPIHVDMPTQITRAMVKLVFSDRPTFSINTGDEIESEGKEKTLEAMLNENKFDTFIQDCADKASYSGAVAIKFVIDRDVSDYPIMVAYPAEDIEVFKKYGNRVEAIAFKDYYKQGKKRYCLYSIYGRGFIDYKLYTVARDGIGVRKEVELSELAETSGLQKIIFTNADGTPSNKVLALYVENKSGAKSDYDGAIDEFMALDEIRSNLILYLRSSKIKTYFHDNHLVQNEDGSFMVPDSYDTDNIIIRDANPSWTEAEMKRDIVDINNSVQGYKDAFNDILLQVLSGVGLSPSSLGYDVSGANASGLALEIRERTSLDTRSERMQTWGEALKEMIKLLFIFLNMEIRGENYVINEDEFDISIQFAEYRRSTQEIVDDLIKRLDNQLIDLDSAYDMLYPELSEEEKDLMISNVQGLLKEEPEAVEPVEDNEVKLDEQDDDMMAKEQSEVSE